MCETEVVAPILVQSIDHGERPVNDLAAIADSRNGNVLVGHNADFGALGVNSFTTRATCSKIVRYSKGDQVAIAVFLVLRCPFSLNTLPVFIIFYRTGNIVLRQLYNRIEIADLALD